MKLYKFSISLTRRRQHHEEFEAQLREIEHHRQEIERLSASQTKN